MQKNTFKAADSCFNSFTTLARASGLTPFSQRFTKIDKVCLSNPQFNNVDIS